MGTYIDLPRIARPALQQRIVAVGDCENDTDSVAASLRFIGLLGKKGKLKYKARGLQIVQTGDLLHKSAPQPQVVRFWDSLGDLAQAAGCDLHLVAGNHEMDILCRLGTGERFGLKRNDRREVEALIRRMRLFHVVGSVLFMHGYPTVRLLRHVHAYRMGTGKGLADYDRDCFQASLDDPKLLRRYAYLRGDPDRDVLLHDLPDPASYYGRYGSEVASLLRSFGISLVVHGHHPERSGVQQDFELHELLPGIRMISQDVQLGVTGLGATLLNQVAKGPTEVLFVNRHNATSAQGERAWRMLRAPKISQAKPAEYAYPRYRWVADEFYFDGSLSALGRIAEAGGATA